MAGGEGLEASNAGSKGPCLTDLANPLQINENFTALSYSITKLWESYRLPFLLVNSFFVVWDDKFSGA